MPDIHAPVEKILAKRREVPANESMLVALSGIDGSGKGYLTGLMVAALQQKGVHAVGITADAWLNLPAQRFNQECPAEHFYHHALRLEEMFESLVLPLKRKRSIRLEANLTEETATAHYRHTYEFEDVDVIVLEGIFLLKRAFRRHYDLALWVDCSWETALQRALKRRQEGLPPAETIRAYRTIYFPAQQIHFLLDDPLSSADVIVNNDPQILHGQAEAGG